MEQSPYMVATVAEWYDENGWGVLFSDHISEGIWVHFSKIDMDGYKTLEIGERVEVDVEGPLGFDQDGFSYRARRVYPLY
jgi:CspA family cold shock protein